MGKSIVNPLYIIKDIYRCASVADFNKAFHGYQGRHGGGPVDQRLTVEAFDVPPSFYPCIIRFEYIDGQHRYQIAAPWDFQPGGVT